MKSPSLFSTRPKNNLMIIPIAFFFNFSCINFIYILKFGDIWLEMANFHYN